MYRVTANIQSDGYIIDADAEILVLDAFGFAPVKVKNGDIDILVNSENSVLEIEVFGYTKTTVTAKQLNATGVAEMYPAVTVISNPIQAKGDNTLLYVLGAAGAIGLIYYTTKKPKPKTVKIT